MAFENKYDLFKVITILYFVNSLVEVTAEAYKYKEIVYITKPLIPLLLMVLYWIRSTQRNTLFFLIMLFSTITNLLFIPDDKTVLFYGVISFTIHRLLLLYFIFKIVEIKKAIPFVLSIIPLLLAFFYLFAASDVPDNSFYLIILHNVMAAVLGALAITSYVVDDNKRNSYLLISVLLFLGLQLIIYVEKYYMSEENIYYLRPLAMSVNALAFFAFYKFVLVSEKVHIKPI
jgi:hypothetical protein